ncbi:fimbrial protein [Citrobacter portucalensis]|uniref:fimbrial protein n=1 Tax=Citrobacter portucalensis TaxID=1639133 RepID=UPI003975E77E
MPRIFSLCLALLLTLSGLLVAGTMELTVKTTITPSTCTMKLYDNNSHQASVIDIGDVYVPEIVKKTNVQHFSLVFSDCEGLIKSQALVTLSGQTGCGGAAGNGAGFKNSLSGTDAASGVAAEVWTTTTPAGAGSTQLNCNTKPTSSVDVSGATNKQTVSWPLSTRIVFETGKSIVDLQPGAFSTQTVFTVEYQ